MAGSSAPFGGGSPSASETAPDLSPLAAPIIRDHSTLEIFVNRKAAISVAVVAGALAFNWLVWAAMPDRQWPAPVELLLIVIAALICYEAVTRARRREPVLVLDQDGITLVATKRTIPWEAVDEVWALEQQGSFGISRVVLMCDLRHPLDDVSSINLPTENLSLNWVDIALAIEARLGKHVVLRRHPSLESTAPA